MKNNTKISKYIKLSLISNFVFLDNFACCKKRDKSRMKNGYSVKKVLDKNNTEQQSNENENQDNPDDINKFIKKRNDFKTKLNNIYTRNNFLPDNKITVDKEDLLNKIDKIKSDTEVNDINKELDTLESKLTNALTALKQDYIIRLKEIINGNKNLGLGLDIKLNEETINNLVFCENIKNIKTDLVNLETKYTESLKNKCENLKKKYNNLKTKINEITDNEQKKAVESLCNNLTDSSFNNIKKYEIYEQLNKQITKIENIINLDLNELKNDFKNDYESYKKIVENLELKITDLNNDLSKKIEDLSIKSFQDVNNTLDNINNQIENEINKLNDDFKQKYKEITAKIKYLPDNSISYSPIDINISKQTKNEDYKKIQDNIRNLETTLTTTIEDLKTKYTTEIKDLNKRLNDLLITEQISSDILDELTYDNLKSTTIASIKNSINNANKECNKKITNYKNECNSKLETATNAAINKNILKIGYISDITTKIKNEINNIQTTENKNNVNKSIEDLTTKIKNENNNKNNEIVLLLKTKEGIQDCNKFPGIKILLNDGKLKLYHNKKFIAESIESVNEVDINDLADVFKYKFTLDLTFKKRKNFKIETTLNNILVNCQIIINSELKKYYETTKHFLLILNLTLNNNHYEVLYDFNTGDILVIYKDSNNENILIGCYVEDGSIQVKNTNNNAFNLTKCEYGDLSYKKTVFGFITNSDNYTFTEKENINEITDYLTIGDLELFKDLKLTND